MGEIIHGDCLDVMRTFPDNHFSGIVTDPPYGLHFMGKDWDHGIPGVHFWQEAVRIIKPGANLLSFGGTRTYHRLTCAIEDAGFEIRDCLCWLFGSGFPKSHNHFGAKGFGTALKPAYEPIIMAMKPLDGTFKQNYEKWGVGGLNIDACRIGTDERTNPEAGFIRRGRTDEEIFLSTDLNKPTGTHIVKGRWPANLLLDEEAAAMLDEQSGTLKSGSEDKHSKTQMGGYQGGFKPLFNQCNYKSDFGGASRFFYCAKTSSRERNEGCEKNHHPTVKPLALMRYLITLISPPTNALILDPFAGSGSTIVAAEQLGIQAIGIEKSAEYCEIAQVRLKNEQPKVKQLYFK